VDPVSVAADANPPGELYCTACEKTFHAGDKCPVDGTRLLRLKARIDPFLGRDLDGRYTVLEKLGQGGMGAVYRAHQHSVDREVAIKVVNSGLVTTPEVIKRFLREAKIASKLSHPNAVGVLDFGQTDDGVFYLVMELVAGRTLDDVFKTEGVFRPERVIRIGTQVCDALEGAHSLQIIHRDLKPSNIMLMAAGRDIVKVLDFGLAKSVSPDQTAATMTNAGSVVGTPAYMPPELARGDACDATSDLYSLGVILYLLASGRLPFESESLHELLALHGSDEPAPSLTGVPVALAAVIARLLRKDRSERFGTAGDVRVALEEALARPNTPPPMPWDTNPSIGPFPATGSAFDQRRSSRELDRLITADTMHAESSSPAMPATATAVRAATTAAVTSPTVERRWWPLVVASGGLIAAIVGFFILRGGSTTSPTPTPTPPPPGPPTALAPKVEAAPPATPAAVAPTPVTPVTPVTPPPVAATSDTTKKPAKPTKPRPLPAVKVTKPTPTPTPTKPPPTKPPGGLPF
jgi:serine/threonine-protein kinase